MTPPETIPNPINYQPPEKLISGLIALSNHLARSIDSIHTIIDDNQMAIVENVVREAITFVGNFPFFDLNPQEFGFYYKQEVSDKAEDSYAINKLIRLIQEVITYFSWLADESILGFWPEDQSLLDNFVRNLLNLDEILATLVHIRSQYFSNPLPLNPQQCVSFSKPSVFIGANTLDILSEAGVICIAQQQHKEEVLNLGIRDHWHRAMKFFSAAKYLCHSYLSKEKTLCAEEEFDLGVLQIYFQFWEYYCLYHLGILYVKTSDYIRREKLEEMLRDIINLLAMDEQLEPLMHVQLFSMRVILAAWLEEKDYSLKKGVLQCTGLYNAIPTDNLSGSDRILQRELRALYGKQR